MRRLGHVKTSPPIADDAEPVRDGSASLSQRAAFVSLVVFCLTMPSNWTQDVPTRYAGRHRGMSRTWAYPVIDTAAYRR
jgi:hypothetical protein